MNKLITIATPNIRALANEFIKNHQAYATAQGLAYEVMNEAKWGHLHPSFSKVYEINRALKDGYEFVIWADADVAFTNHRVDLIKLLQPNYFLTGYKQNNWKTWDYICNGLLVIRNCPAAVDYVTTWIDYCLNGCPGEMAGQRTFIKDHPWEQWPFDKLIREIGYKGVYVAHAPEIGCFCPETWHDGIIWQPGWPSVHMAGQHVTWERRAAVYAEIYLPQVIWK